MKPLTFSRMDIDVGWARVTLFRESAKGIPEALVRLIRWELNSWKETEGKDLAEQTSALSDSAASLCASLSFLCLQENLGVFCGKVVLRVDASVEATISYIGD